jgi:3-oxoacyl-[acyl-carrier protein] reductase
MSGTEHVAVVTGGSRGIGRAIVLELVASHIKVAFTYRSSHDAAHALCREVQELSTMT